MANSIPLYCVRFCSVIEREGNMTAATGGKERRNVLNDMVMFLVSGFIGLAYLIATPFVMAWMLAPLALDTVRKYNAARRAAKASGSS
jgi:hypothetical protein